VEAGGGGRQYDGGTGFAIAEDPRDQAAFVAGVVQDWGERRLRVDRAVVGFILRRVLVSEREWARGLKEGRFKPGHVKAKIEESLELAADRAESAGALEIDVPLAEAVYNEIRTARLECEFPFAC
jgi:hypothetical protein